MYNKFGVKITSTVNITWSGPLLTQRVLLFNTGNVAVWYKWIMKAHRHDRYKLVGNFNTNITGGLQQPLRIICVKTKQKKKNNNNNNHHHHHCGELGLHETFKSILRK